MKYINNHHSSNFRMHVALILIGMIIPAISFGQFNLKIGYDGAYSKATHLNEVISTYNSEFQTTLNEAVSPFHWLHGLNMGVRYKWDFYAQELAWESLGNSITAIEVNGNTGIEKKLYLRLNHLTWNHELLFGNIGIGTSLEYGFYKIETDLSGTSAKKILAESQPVSSKIYLALNLQGSEILGVSIKPYYRYQWGDGLALNATEEYLEIPIRNKIGKFSHFGIHICFYNGPQ